MQMLIPAVGSLFGGGATAAATVDAIGSGGTILASTAEAGSAYAAAAGAAGAGLTATEALGYGGMALSGVSGYMQQQAANKAANFNSLAAKQEADQTIEQGRIAEQSSRIKTAQNLGAERAGAASGGIDPNVGTPLQQQETTAKFGEFDALTTRYNAMQKAQSLETQAAAYKSSEISPILSGVTSAVSSGVSFLGNKATRKMYSQNSGSIF